MLFEKGILLCCNGFRFEQLFLFLLSHVSLFLFPELEILLIEIYPKEDMSFDLEKQHDNLVWLFCNIKKAVLNCNFIQVQAVIFCMKHKKRFSKI